MNSQTVKTNNPNQNSTEKSLEGLMDTTSS